MCALSQSWDICQNVPREIKELSMKPPCWRTSFSLTPPTGLLVYGGPVCPGKYTYSPLRIQCDSCLEKVTHGRLPWLPPLFCILSTLACSLPAFYRLALPSSLNIVYRQDKTFKTLNHSTVAKIVEKMSSVFTVRVYRGSVDIRMPKKQHHFKRHPTTL